jgi:Kef-type K+ transport system membrane component KefB
MSSTAIVLQTLDEKGLRQGPVGRAAFGVLLLQDLAVIPLFALLPLLATSRRLSTPRPPATAPAWSASCRSGPRACRCSPPWRR